MSEFTDKKQAAIDALRGMLPGCMDKLMEIDPRMVEYYRQLSEESSAIPFDEHDKHNYYEILGGIKFLRILKTYPFNVRKVQMVIMLREGTWKEDNGHWLHVHGGLKCPGTNGQRVYRWTPFQVFILASVFGPMAWVDTRIDERMKPELLPSEKVVNGSIFDYRRLCTDFTFYAPRKTDKTGLAAFIQFVYFFLEDDNAEIYCCANSSEQAKILYSRTRQLVSQYDGGKMIRSTQTVTDWREGFRNIRNSSIRPLSAGGKTKDGMFAQLCCADEFGSAAYTNGKSDMLSLVNVIQSSMGPRREPMTFTTTTAGTITTGPFMEKLQAIHTTLERELDYIGGKVEPSFEDDRRLCLCLEPDEWEKNEEAILTYPTLRYKVNPMLGIIAQHSSYDGWISEAKVDKTKMNELMTKYFNVYASNRVSDWVAPDKIRQLQVPVRVDDCTADRGWVVICGADFSKGDDLHAVTYLAVNLETRQFFADMDAWVTSKTLEEISIRPLYEKWVQNGWLHISPGEVLQPSLPVGRIIELHNKGVNILRIGYDAYQAKEPINALKAWVYDLGQNPEAYVVPVSQTYASYNPAVLELDYCIKADPALLHFSQNPMWPWEFGNVVLDEDTRMGNQKPVKRNRGSDSCKVDNIQCLCTCFILYDQLDGAEHIG